MTGNSKDSEWYVTSQENRTRKKVQLTLSDEARDKLERLSKRLRTTKSAIVEDLILKAGK